MDALSRFCFKKIACVRKFVSLNKSTSDFVLK